MSDLGILILDRQNGLEWPPEQKNIVLLSNFLIIIPAKHPNSWFFNHLSKGTHSFKSRLASLWVAGVGFWCQDARKKPKWDRIGIRWELTETKRGPNGTKVGPSADHMGPSGDQVRTKLDEMGTKLDQVGTNGDQVGTKWDQVETNSKNTDFQFILRCGWRC